MELLSATETFPMDHPPSQFMLRPQATSGTEQGLCPGFWLVETLRKIRTEAPIKTWTISRVNCLFFLASTGGTAVTSTTQ